MPNGWLGRKAKATGFVSSGRHKKKKPEPNRLELLNCRLTERRPREFPFVVSPTSRGTVTVFPQSRPPLFVLARTSKCLGRAASTLLVWCSHPGLRSLAPRPTWSLPDATGWQRGHSLSPSSLVLRLTFRVLLECPDSPRGSHGPMDLTLPQKSILPWGSWFFDAFRSGQRPTFGLPHRTVLRLQTFSVS